MGFFSRKKKNDVDGGGSRDSGSSSSNPYAKQAPNNPYAQQPAASDPYANPSQSSFGRQGLPGGPRIGGPPRRDDTMDSQSTAPPPYKPTSDAASGYGKTSLGAQGGYGRDRYSPSIHSLDTKPTHTSGAPGVAAQRNGGYGGLGDPEGEKRDLFSGYEVAPQRRVPEPSQQSQQVDDYGGNRREEEELSPEQQQEMEISDIKMKIKGEKQATANTTERMLVWMEEAKGSGIRSAALVHTQGDGLNNIQKGMQSADKHNRLAREQTKNLERLNRSMFLPAHLSTKKQNEADAAKLSAELNEKANSESLNAEIYSTNANRARAMGAVNKQPSLLGANQSGDAKNYRFENDDEDDKIDDRINGNIELLCEGAGVLKNLATGIGNDLDRQNKQIGRIAEMTDNVDVQVRKNRMNLDRIR